MQCLYRTLVNEFNGLRLFLYGRRLALNPGKQRLQGAVSSPGEGRQIVIWFYAKRGEHLRCEIRQQTEGGRFELVITEPDGSERVESFADSSLLKKRSRQLEEEWQAKGWDGPFGRDY